MQVRFLKLNKRKKYGRINKSVTKTKIWIRNKSRRTNQRHKRKIWTTKKSVSKTKKRMITCLSWGLNPQPQG